MKRLLFVTVCLFIASVTAFAQQRATPEESTKRTMEWMTTELKLTAQQVTQVEPVILSMAKERVALIEKANGDFGSVRDDMQKINTKTEEALGKILTKEQLAEYQKQAAQRRGGNR